jgi:hypothetical protein
MGMLVAFSPSRRKLGSFEKLLHPKLFLFFCRLCGFCVGSFLSHLFRVPREAQVREEEGLAVAGVIIARPPAFACVTDSDVDLWF